MLGNIASLRRMVRAIGLLLLLLPLAACDRGGTDVQAAQEPNVDKPPADRTETLAELLERVCAAPPGVEVHRYVEYAKVGDHALSLDLYVPNKRDGEMPLLVWIHGGGWHQGTKDRCPLAWLGEHGYAVASIQYRLSQQAAFPAQIHDCKGAIRWLRANRETYGYDPQKIGVAGISAGGHLAALLGTSAEVAELEGDVGGNLEHSSRVDAVHNMCGVADFLRVIEDSPEYSARADTSVARLFGGAPAEKRELAKLASPAHHVTRDDAPLLIFHGDRDALVPLVQSRLLHGLYQQTNLPVSLDVIPGGEHVSMEFWDDKHCRLVREFFNTHLLTPPSGTKPGTARFEE